jgi:hypothetical protein
MKRKQWAGVLEARKFVLKDKSGKACGVFEVTPMGPQLALSPDGGKMWLRLRMGPTGAYLEWEQRDLDRGAWFNWIWDRLELGWSFPVGSGVSNLYVKLERGGLALYDDNGRLLCSLPKSRNRP